MKTSRILCAALAAVMTTGMVSGVTASADFTIVPKSQSLVFLGDGESTEKGYDEADWEAFRDRYRNDWCIDEDEEDDLGITDDGIVYSLCEAGVSLVEYLGKGEDLVIPETIDGRAVVGFSSTECDFIDYGFSRLENVKTVTIKAPIKKMVSVFMECPNLEKAVLPDTIVEFREGPEDSTCHAFRDCPKLKEVYFPKSVRLVDGAPFHHTPWLDSLEEKEKLVVVGDGVLLSGRKAEGKVVIPEGVKSVAGYAFDSNNMMTELVIPSTMKNTEKYNWGYGQGAFVDCNNLEKITLKNGAKGFVPIGYNFPALKKVIVPPSVTKNEARSMLGWDEDHLASKKVTFYYYKGTGFDKVISKKLYKGLKKSVLPGKTKSITVSAKKNAAKVTWKSVSTATGYQIQVSPDKTFKKNVTAKYVKDKATVTYTFKKLKSGKKYYVRMRTYKTLSGKKYYGNFTKTRTVTAK